MSLHYTNLYMLRHTIYKTNSHRYMNFYRNISVYKKIWFVYELIKSVKQDLRILNIQFIQFYKFKLVFSKFPIYLWTRGPYAARAFPNFREPASSVWVADGGGVAVRCGMRRHTNINAHAVRPYKRVHCKTLNNRRLFKLIDFQA